MRKKFPLDTLLTVDAQRIGIVKPSALGDVVQTLPLLPVLRQRFPEARISWVVNAGLAGLLRDHPDLDEVIPFRPRGGWRDWQRLLSRLRRERFDLVFDLQGLLRSAVLTAWTRAPLRVGLETAREGAHLACHLTIPETSRYVPAHERYWRVAEALGCGGAERPTHVHVPETDRRWTADRLQTLQRPLLAVHPGAKWVTKRWPVEKFAAVAARAMREFDVSTVVLGSPDEGPLGERFVAITQNLYPAARLLKLTGETSLKQLTAVLQQVDVLLTNDSGPMHLAAAMGTPVVGVFTCTSPVRSGPPEPAHRLVSTALSCAASYKKKCPHQGERHMACLDELSTARVLDALRNTIADLGFERRSRAA